MRHVREDAPTALKFGNDRLRHSAGCLRVVLADGEPVNLPVNLDHGGPGGRVTSSPRAAVG
jgi:hypothetical protein